MSALELAEERARNPWMEPECNAEDFEKLAIALRQQQAEIEALKAKTLTDEEIIECWNETHPAVVMLNAELPLFARAILRKAQEK